MSKLQEKFLEVYSFLTLRDVTFTSPSVNHIPFFDEDNQVWINGDTSKILLMTPKVLNRAITIPANRTAIMGSFRSNSFRVKVEGTLKVI